MTNLEKLYRELAITHELPVATVEQVCRSEFKLVRETMEQDSFSPIRLSFIGLFKPIDTKVARYKDSKYWDKETSSTKKI